VAATRQIVNESVDLVTHPGNALDLGREAASYAAALARVTLLSNDPKTALKGSLGVSKHAAWTDVLPLEEVKALGQTLGGTVNDVLVTLVTGGLRRYLLGRGDNVDGLDVRAMMPVNLRAPNEAIKLGNHFGLVVPALPVGIADPLERFLTVKLRMDQLKNSPEAFVTFAILQTMGWAPIGVEDVGVWFFASKTSLVLTNVPGPRQKLYLAGQRIENLMFWVPQSGRMGVGVSILSYAGGVTIGVITDAGLAPDPETIVAGIHEEFAALKQQVGQVAASAYKGPVILGNGDEHGRCHATTQEGEPCKNRAMAGSAFCHVHARIVADSEDLQRL
jgi:WS/DGAT/MGAT family acyltransferase